MFKVNIYCIFFLIFSLQVFCATKAANQMNERYATCEDNCYEITISNGLIMNLNSKILAIAGPISMGDGNIVDPYAQIINRETKYNGEVLKIGDGNIFKTYSIVESHVIGNGNIFGPNSYVGPLVTVGNGCIIGPGVRITGTKHIPDGLVIN